MFVETKASLVVGFTGTRSGMTARQQHELTELLMKLRFHKFRHGDCVGADAQAHAIVTKLFPGKVDIMVHPCNLHNQRAYMQGTINYEPLPPIERNHRIVDLSDVLIACPATTHELLRSGTWATIRYARKIGKRVYIIYP